MQGLYMKKINDTTGARALYSKQTELTLSKFIITDGKHLSYEYADSDECRLVFITGKNEAEKELPPLYFPYYIENLSGVNYLVTDLRPFVKVKDDSFTDLKDVVKNRDDFNFTVNRTIFYMLYLTEPDKVTQFSNTVTIAFVKTIAFLLNNIFRLDSIEFSDIAVVSAYYYLCVTYPDESVTDITGRLTPLLKKSERIKDSNYIRSVIDKLDGKVETLAQYVEALKTVVESGKLDNLSANTLLSAGGAIYNGTYNTINMAIAFEHYPTMVAILHDVVVNKFTKKSRLGIVVKNFNTILQVSKFEKSISAIILEETLA